MPKNLRDLADFYGGLLEQHDSGARAVGWQSLAQRACFAQLAATDGLVSGSRVLDVGCGLGDFKRFLDARGTDVDYTGWDICEPAIERARDAHPAAHFEVRDIVSDPPTEPFDVVIASGAMSLRIEDHEDFVASMIRAMYGAAGYALAFNLLSGPFAVAHPHGLDPDYFYAEPPAVLALCLELTPRVVLDHYEQAQIFTVRLYRDARATLERLLALHRPGDAWSDDHEAIIEHCLGHGLTAQAMRFLESLPPSAASLEAMGRVAFEIGDEKLQLTCWQRALELAPDDEDLARRVDILARWID